MSGNRGGCCNAEIFWQQDIDESLILKKAYTKGGQWKCCLFLGIFCVGLGAVLMAEAGKVKELVIEYGINDEFIDFEVTEDMTGEVFFYYSLSGFYGNYRNYVENRENLIVGSALMKYRCKGEGAPAQTLDHALKLRNGVKTPEKFADLQTFANFTTNVINDGDGAPESAPDGQTLFPCGLVAFSMFADEYSLYNVEAEEKVPMNFDNIAWSSDMAHFDETIIEQEDGSYKIGDYTSWIRTDLMKQRFAIWYRTSASTKVKHLWGKIPGGLKKGKYKLILEVNGPIWEDWGVKKSVVISTVSSTGGKGNGFIGVSCIVWGVLLLLMGLVWLVAPKPVRKVMEGEEGDASDPNWAAPR
eukprot:gnl/MRDRNA2_/MRDRNA2_126262_c0_seq1.p1 gnl/MRDRNA2_/MRDRNA2_126262_c0~~gnl/MRDRNA2_/MRDRNA2_126262_c0_seq1.p1  ORF type:complete len:357 (+),score=60.43 gnl/MRDRNA2_/MRDRNA2_126262_c0_seq1:141-1211(+)